MLDGSSPQEPDTLLAALVWLTRHHGRPRSPQALVAGLPHQGRLRPELALRALQAAGFSAGLVERRLAELHPLLLPAVLLLRDGSACILERRDDACEGTPPRCRLLLPRGDAADGSGCESASVDEARLEAEYSGFALVASPRPLPADGAAEEADADPQRHWLWGTLRRFLPYYRSALVAALLTNVLTLVLGLVATIVFDRVIPHQAFVTLWALACGAALALAFDLLARQLRSHLIDRAGKKADLLLGAALFRQTLGVRMEFRPASSGVYAHQLAQVEVVRDFFTSATLAALSDLPFVLLFVAMIFLIAGPLGWVMLLAIPLILGLAWVLQGALRRAMNSHLSRQAELHGLLVEAVEGLEDLKTSGAEGRFLHRHDAATAACAESALRGRTLSSWSANLTMVAQQLVTLVMLVWGVYLIRDGAITGGALIGAVMFAGRAIGPLGSVVALANRYQGARAALLVLDRLMKQPTERDAQRQYMAAPALSGRIALHGLHFAYPAIGANPAPPVLQGLDLRIDAGERVAILGRIGSGKSTVLRLLAGLYQPAQGRVEVDGVDLRQIDPGDYRVAVGFVPQEPRLFNGSLRDNVVMGRGLVTAERLDEVARLTGLDRLVAAHPQGWELPVGERGHLLSGGQRQLVALARGLATQPRLLLMDEPTSSMDAQSESAFVRQLQDAAAGRTLVVVTHRPALLDLVQRIVVVEAGRILVDGPKAQVLSRLAGSGHAAAAASAAPAPVATAPRQPRLPAHA